MLTLIRRFKPFFYHVCASATPEPREYGYGISQVVPPIVKGDQTVVLSITEASLVVKLRLNVLSMHADALVIPSF